jgi:hypothetical protein
LSESDIKKLTHRETAEYIRLSVNLANTYRDAMIPQEKEASRQSVIEGFLEAFVEFDGVLDNDG